MKLALTILFLAYLISRLSYFHVSKSTCTIDFLDEDIVDGTVEVMVKSNNLNSKEWISESLYLRLKDKTFNCYEYQNFYVTIRYPRTIWDAIFYSLLSCVCIMIIPVLGILQS